MPTVNKNRSENVMEHSLSGGTVGGVVPEGKCILVSTFVLSMLMETVKVHTPIADTHDK